MTTMSDLVRFLIIFYGVPFVLWYCAKELYFDRKDAENERKFKEKLLRGDWPP